MREITDYDAFNRPFTLVFTAYRAPLGSSLTFALGHAFLTALQRGAWHIGYSDVYGYPSFNRPDTGGVSLGVMRRFADIGRVQRIGFGQRIGFLGGVVTYERVVPAPQAVIISDTGLIADPSAPLGGPFAPYQNVRLNAVVGVRDLSFREARGFDGLAAVQNLATGVQFGALLGHGNDTFLSGDLYAGLGSSRSFAGLRFEGEARHDETANEWDSMVESGRMAWYLKPSDAHVVIISDESSGGWHVRIPFQLSLGAWPGGVRGYQNSRIVGAIRNVARGEDEQLAPRLQVTRHAGVGSGDIRRCWAGLAGATRRTA